MRTIIISRTDAIGDVVLTLPLAGLLKARYPDARVVMVCAAYARPVVECCEHVDGILDWTELQRRPKSELVDALRAQQADAVIHVFPRKELAWAARQARIPLRIGTSHRLYHLWTCTRLVALGRKRSPYHEAQLNVLLARPLLGGPAPPLQTLWTHYGLTRIPPLPDHLAHYITPNTFTLIVHAKSRGSAAEWPADRWRTLLGRLPGDRLRICLTGTAEEGDLIRRTIGTVEGVHDLTGMMTLQQLVAFIAAADGLVAASTGPLHIAAALGKHVLGLFPDTPPMHPGRWAPLGRYAEVVEGTVNKEGLLDVEVESVFKKVLQWLV